jgi:hypothetical protein
MQDNLLPDNIFENLPELLNRLTCQFTERERDIVLLSSISVLSACLPKVYGNYGGNKCYSNLYLLVIAPPASGKGIMGKSKLLIEKIHDSIKQNSMSEIEDCKHFNKGKKQDKSTCPELLIKILPGNVSSSKIYKHLQNDVYGLLMFETEADTISGMLKQDWGNFSDVLRKAFHHETVSISREIDDKYFEINQPKLSLVISGTPGQVAPLINSQENGLFSRFIFYYFNDAFSWKDVSPEANPVDLNDVFSKVGEVIFQLHENLLSREREMEVRLTNQQWEKFNRVMDYAVRLLTESNAGMIPTIKRHGLIMFRICMILSVLRNHDGNTDEDVIICSDNDFDTAISIIKATIDHSIFVSNLLDNGVTNNKKKLNMQENIVLAHLKEDFTRSEVIGFGSTMNIPTRTLDFIIKKLLTLGLIYKVSNGKFKKTSVKQN